MNIPVNYILDVIYRNCKRVTHKNHNVYNFECPICREGKSANKKKRGFFFAKENYFHCQNCQRSWSVPNWIMEVENISFKEMIKDSENYDNTLTEIIERHTSEHIKQPQSIITQSLPNDCVNLNDPIQLQHHKDNKIIQKCLSYINERRLNTAINKPKAFYISLTDDIYRNRLCIPFYDINEKIIYFQARALFEKDEAIAKYLSKKDAEKSLYGINKISPNIDYIFIFEGPIDSMFCANAVAVCGLSLTDLQEKQLDKYRLFEKIWVLDNQLENKDVVLKYETLIERNSNVFFWPDEFNSFKDLNELCVYLKRDSIPIKLLLNNTLNGMAAKIKLKELKDKIKTL